MSLPPIQSLNLPLMRSEDGSINPIFEILPDSPAFIFYNNILYNCPNYPMDRNAVFMMPMENGIHMKTAHYVQSTQIFESSQEYVVRSWISRFIVKPFDSVIGIQKPIPQIPAIIFYNGISYCTSSLSFENSSVWVNTINALGVQLQVQTHLYQM